MTATSTLTATPVCVKSPNETRIAAVSFLGCLESGETLTGTPTITAAADKLLPGGGTPAALTLTEKAVSAGVLSINDVSVPAGQAVTVKVAGGSAGIPYTITVVVVTSAGQTIERFLPLRVASS